MDSDRKTFPAGRDPQAAREHPPAPPYPPDRPRLTEAERHFVEHHAHELWSTIMHFYLDAAGEGKALRVIVLVELFDRLQGIAHGFVGNEAGGIPEFEPPPAGHSEVPMGPGS